MVSGSVTEALPETLYKESKMTTTSNTPLKPETVELLNRVKEAIRTYPAHFYMGDWFETDCGTTACIAGWTLCLSQNKLTTPEDEDQVNILIEKTAAAAERHRYISVYEMAADLLQISDMQAQKLFYWTAWPLPFISEYSDCSHEVVERFQKFVDVACRRIDHFIQTGE